MAKGYGIVKAMEYEMEYFSKAGFLLRKRLIVTYHGISAVGKAIGLSCYDVKLPDLYRQIRSNMVSFPFEGEIPGWQSTSSEIDNAMRHEIHKLHAQIYEHRRQRSTLKKVLSDIGDALIARDSEKIGRKLRQANKVRNFSITKGVYSEEILRALEAW